MHLKALTLLSLLCLERISEPSNGHDQAGEGGESVVEAGVELVPYDEASEVVEPAGLAD
jgi:hypothetical protein